MGLTLNSIVFYFFLFSFGGWIIELVYRSITNKRFINPGTLFGPYVPLYGFGAMGVIVLYSLLWNEPIYVRFIGYTIVMTIIEYVTGILLDKIFNKRFWDYYDEFMNYKGLICVKFSLYWGMASIVFEKLIFPVAQYLYQNLTNEYVVFGNSVMLIVIVMDIAITTDLVNVLQNISDRFDAGDRFNIKSKLAYATVSFDNMKKYIQNDFIVREYRKSSEGIATRLKRIVKEKRFNLNLQDLLKDFFNRFDH